MGDIVSKMVERVAMAMTSLAVAGGYKTRWEVMDDEGREAARALARAAIDAMREPTDEMVNAAYSGSDFQAASESDIRSGWRSMINEALK